VEAAQAREIAERLRVDFVLHEIRIEPGPNLEARARAERRAVLPPGAMTGHTADDQAETLLIRLLRGSGSSGLAAMRAGAVHPILALRRSETEALCGELDVRPVRDRSNDVADVWRNRIRAELLPLAADISGRDPAPILSRTAELLGAESDFLDDLADGIDPTDARAIRAAEPVLARRALRRWLTRAGYPPDAASIDRVMAIARGDGIACELPGGRRVERSDQRFRIVDPER
jgi:tRNA(Ile)-lysidine synthase